MFLWYTSPPSSQSARFLNKVTISCPRKLTFDLLPVLWYELELVTTSYPEAKGKKPENIKTQRHSGLEAFHRRLPVCRFLCLLSPLFLISPYSLKGAGKPLPGRRSKRWDACIGFSSLAFSFGDRDCLWPSFDMHHLLALWPLLLLASLVNLYNLVSWSLSKEATGIYTFTKCNKAPLFHQSFGPRVFLSLPLFFFISLFLSDSLERKSQPCNPGDSSLFPSFTFLSLTPDHQVPVH